MASKQDRINEILAGPWSGAAAAELHSLGYNSLRINSWARKKKLKVQADNPGPGMIDSSGQFHSTPDDVLQQIQEIQRESIKSQEEVNQSGGNNIDSPAKPSSDAGTLRQQVGEAQSPTSTSQPGAYCESIDNFCTSKGIDAAQVQLVAKAEEKIPTTLQQEDTTSAATRRIQVETDNLTAKVEKFLAARKVYIDAVSGPLSHTELLKEVRITACKIAKFQKIIMDKIAEYENKKMNKALTLVVAAMPSSLRYMFADQKFLNTQNVVKEFNEITNGMCDQMEGILLEKLNIPSLIEKADAQAASGVLWADPNAQAAVTSLLGGVGGIADGAGIPSAGTPGAGGGGETTSSDVSVGDNVVPVPSGP